jgi:hypothetical protein
MPTLKYAPVETHGNTFQMASSPNQRRAGDVDGDAVFVHMVFLGNRRLKQRNSAKYKKNPDGARPRHSPMRQRASIDGSPS